MVPNQSRATVEPIDKLISSLSYYLGSILVLDYTCPLGEWILQSFLKDVGGLGNWKKRDTATSSVVADLDRWGNDDSSDSIHSDDVHVDDGKNDQNDGVGEEAKGMEDENDDGDLKDVLDKPKSLPYQTDDSLSKSQSNSEPNSQPLKSQSKSNSQPDPHPTTTTNDTPPSQSSPTPRFKSDVIKSSPVYAIILSDQGIDDCILQESELRQKLMNFGFHDEIHITTVQKSPTRHLEKVGNRGAPLLGHALQNGGMVRCEPLMEKTQWDAFVAPIWKRVYAMQFGGVITGNYKD